MESIELGKSGVKLPVLGMGTWKLGADYAGSVQVLKRGIELGIHFVDTAELYGNEVIVGEAIKGSGVFLATKVSPGHFKEKDVLAACDESLKRLGTKHIDLYQLHWPNHNVPIKETMRAMERLMDEGKIRHIGVSNFSVAEFEEARAAMHRHEIVSNQIEYSVIVREVGDAFMEFAKRNNVAVIAYSPLGSGALFDERYGGAHVLLEDIGKRYGKTASQVALNWLMQKGDISVIPKACSLHHLEENLGAVGWKLKGDDIKIDEIGQLKKPLSLRMNTPVARKMSGFWSKVRPEGGEALPRSR